MQAFKLAKALAELMNLLESCFNDGGGYAEGELGDNYEKSCNYADVEQIFCRASGEWLIAYFVFAPPDILLNQTLTTQCSRHLRVAHAHHERALLSKYTKPATTSDCFFLVPVKCQGCSYY